MAENMKASTFVDENGNTAEIVDAKARDDIAKLDPAKKYGVRWRVTDPNDLGERCFAAKGMNATIGIGGANGQSDFDNVYPWSEMKRCNIKKNVNGATIVVFERKESSPSDGSASGYTPIVLDIKRDGYYDKTGTLVSSVGRQNATVNVAAGEEYVLDTFQSSALIPAVLFFDKDDNFVKYDHVGSGTEVETTITIVIPEGITKMIVQSATSPDSKPMTLVKKSAAVDTPVVDTQPIDTAGTDTFVRIPKFYVEKYISGGYEYRVVSATGTTPHPAFVENGVELDEIFVSAYEGYIADGKMRSVSGVIPTSNETIESFLAAATANGVNYSLFDMRCVDALWTLMAVEFGCRNTNHYLGYGYSDFMQPISTYAVLLAETATNRVVTNKFNNAEKAFMPVGSNITICKGDQRNIVTQAKILSIVDSDDGTQTVFTFDGEPVDVDTTCFIGSAAATTGFCETSANPLSWHTGRSDFVAGSKTRNPIRYRWIENIYGNLWHYLPDVAFNELQMYVCKNMKNYSVPTLSDDYHPIGDVLTYQNSNGSKLDTAGENFWITSLLDDVFAKGVSFGKTYDKSLLSTQAFGAYYYLSDGLNFIAHGGGFDHLWRCNMLTNRAWISETQKWYLYGARLMFKKIN
jgi:hypothetical protein